MTKRCLIPALLVTCAAGCTTTYHVHFNGFSELAEPIQDQASVHVVLDADSQNPIFDREIKAKIETLLKWHGYIPADAPAGSDYRLTFQAGVNSRSVSGLAPVYHPAGGLYGGYWEGYHFGYATYIPFSDTLYDQWLVLKLFALPPAGTSRRDQLVWVGEAITSTSVADLRQAVNYLLVAGFEYLGVDTKRRIGLTIRADDPRIIQLTAEQ